MGDFKNYSIVNARKRATLEIFIAQTPFPFGEARLPRAGDGDGALIFTTMFNGLIKYFLNNRLVTFIFLITFVVYGAVTMPFNWNTGILPRDPIPVDAIPDIETISRLSPPNGWADHPGISKIKSPIH